MIRRFTTKKDILAGFAGAMNLISPEVENHHEKVAYLSYRLAEMMELPEKQRQLAFLGGLMHDIGGILQRDGVSLLELERHAGEISGAGAMILRGFSLTQPFSAVVEESQTPWRRLKAAAGGLKAPQRLGQIVHLADVITLLLKDTEPVLNQLPCIREAILGTGDREFNPEVLAAFDRLCGVEAAWLDVLYRPQLFLDMLTEDRAFSLEETVKLTAFMSRIIDFRSPFTAMHSAGVAAAAVSLAELSGMSEDECSMMRIAGYLHDIGKLKVPNELLEKPGKLTEPEFNVVKEHAYFTWLLLKDIRGFEQIALWASQHHEKLSGGGYPFHLTRGELSLGSRIMAVADVFSAVAEDRPYRPGMSRERAAGVLREDAERGLLSRPVVELLLENYEMIDRRRSRESLAASRRYRETLRGGRED